MPDNVIVLPIYIKLGKSIKTTFSLNLNTYRNAHYQTLNQAKIRFEELVAPWIRHLPLMSKVDLTYRLFSGSRRSIDIANVCCIVDKFFCDTLVNQGKLIDDNMDVISEIVYQWGQVDSKDPRIEVTLTNIEIHKPKEEPMKIFLTHLEIEEALREFAYRRVQIYEGHEVHVDLTTEDGYATAEIIIGQAVKAADENMMAQTIQTKKRGRPPGSKNEPKMQTSQAPRGREPEPEEEEADVESGDFTSTVEYAAKEAAAQAMAPAVAQAAPTNAYIAAMPQPVEEGQTPPAPVTSPGPSLFPSLGTSAPAPITGSPPVAGPTSAAPKSLFANLTKPVNTPAPE